MIFNWRPPDSALLRMREQQVRHDRIRVQAAQAQADRDRWIRAFNRLEKAVTKHLNDCIDSDGLAHAHKAVMRDLTTPYEAQQRASEASNAQDTSP